MDVRNISVKDLIPYDRNTKKHDKTQINNVAESIKQYGFVQPIVIDKDNVVVIGHCRLLAAKQLKMKEVPCVCVDDLTEEQVKALRIVDNKSNESEWDLDILPDELAELDLSDFDFDFGIEDEAEETEIVEDEALSTEEDEIPEVEEDAEPTTKRGDVWQLGNHRLVCGDSTDAETVRKLMNGKTADCVFTDPPYGMKKESDGVLNDNLNYDDLLEFNKKWIPLTFEHLKDMGGWYCWGIDEPLMDIYSHILKPLARKNEIVIRNYLTWAKHSAFGMKSSLMLSYPRETEKCWFVVKGANWNNNNAEFFNYKYQPIVDYLNEQAQIVGLNAKKLRELTGVQMWSHWFTHSQFTVIPENHYKKLQEEYNKDGAFLLSHAELRELIGAVDDKKQPDKPYFDLTWFDDGDIPLTDVWRNSITTIKERENTGGHATPKPLKICERGIVTSTKAGEIVLDLFGGSGSTLIACEQLNRTCYMMELDPKYCDVILQRYINLTGTSEDVYRLNADGTKTKYADLT